MLIRYIFLVLVIVFSFSFPFIVVTLIFSWDAYCGCHCFFSHASFFFCFILLIFNLETSGAHHGKKVLHFNTMDYKWDIKKFPRDNNFLFWKVNVQNFDLPKLCKNNERWNIDIGKPDTNKWNRQSVSVIP